MMSMLLRQTRGLWVLVLITALVIAALAQAQEQMPADDDNPLVITGAWARPSAEGVDVSGAYLRIANYGDTDDRLIAGETDAARMVELHTMQMQGDMMRMRPVDGIDVPAGGRAVLRPGGLHLMLMGLTVPLVEGETVMLTLRFESGREMTVEADITHEPIPLELEPDALTAASLEAVAAGTYVGQVIDPPIQVQDFEAPSSHADVTRFSDTDGTWRVIFFGYMHCPDFCPLTLVDYKHAKAKLGDAVDDVTFVYVSVDAVRDTADALEKYLANFDTAFVGFSADDATLVRIQPDYGFYYERRMAAGSQAVYTIDHSTRSYVVDRDGVLRTSFAYDTQPEAIASALRWYIEHEND